MTRQEDQEQQKGHGIVSGAEPSAEEIERRIKERHRQTDHGSSETDPDPETGATPA